MIKNRKLMRSNSPSSLNSSTSLSSADMKDLLLQKGHKPQFSSKNPRKLELLSVDDDPINQATKMLEFNRRFSRNIILNRWLSRVFWHL